jgi:hypothetical protein
MLYSIYHYFPYAFLAVLGITLIIFQVVDYMREERTKPRR